METLRDKIIKLALSSAPAGEITFRMLVSLERRWENEIAELIKNETA
jgi:hypothetical protein